MTLTLIELLGLGGLLSHTAIYSREFGIPAIKISKDHFLKFKTGQKIKSYSKDVIIIKDN